MATGLVGAGFFMAIKRSYSPGRMLIKCLFTIPFVLGCLLSAIKMGPYGPFLIVFMAVVLSFLWTPHIAEIVCSPLTNLFDGGNVPGKETALLDCHFQTKAGPIPRSDGCGS